MASPSREPLSTLSDHPELKLVTVSEFLDSFPANLSADQLHSGSWVDVRPGLVTHQKNRAGFIGGSKGLFNDQRSNRRK